MSTSDQGKDASKGAGDLPASCTRDLLMTPDALRVRHIVAGGTLIGTLAYALDPRSDGVEPRILVALARVHAGDRGTRAMGRTVAVGRMRRSYIERDQGRARRNGDRRPVRVLSVTDFERLFEAIASPRARASATRGEVRTALRAWFPMGPRGGYAQEPQRVDD